MAIFETRNYGKLASSMDVRSFLLEKRGLGAVPAEISDAVYTELRYLSPLLRAVTIDKLAGKARFEIRKPTELADLNSAWIENGKTGFPDLTGDGTVLVGEVEGYAVGAFASLCNSYYTEMTAAAITMYVQSIARSVVLSLEEAILRGDGKRKLRGIIPALPDDRKITAAGTGEALYGELIDAAATTETGLYASPEEFYAVVNRRTAMKLLHMIGTTETQAPAYLPRLMARIALSERMQNGEILMGYLPVYRLFEREQLKAELSEHLRFVEDNTIALVSGRYDGIPFHEKSFVHVTMSSLA